jgi:hypothetical protein
MVFQVFILIQKQRENLTPFDLQKIRLSSPVDLQVPERVTMGSSSLLRCLKVQYITTEYYFSQAGIGTYSIPHCKTSASLYAPYYNSKIKLITAS